MPNIDSKKIIVALALGLASLHASPAFAAGSGMPWEGPLEQILDSVTGPVARVLGAFAIVVTGFAFAFSEGGSGARKMFGVVLGLTIAFAATSFFLPFFGFGGGAVF